MTDNGPPPDRSIGFAELVADLALAYADESAPDRLPLVEQIVAGAIATIPGVIAAAVETVDRTGRLTAPVTVGQQVARAVMDAQNAMGEGPSLESLREQKQVMVTDVEIDARWPQVAAAAHRVGVRSVLCTPMEVNRRDLGVLVLLGGDSHFGDPAEDSQMLARIFAAHAALALSGSASSLQMAEALSSRDLIGQAKGILMERFRLAPDAAFALLVQTSSHTNTRLRSVCEQLCDTGVLRQVASPGSRSTRPAR